MTRQFGLDAAGMHSRSAHATIAMPFVKSNREEDVCGLGSAIRNKRVIGCPLKIGVIEVDVREAVT
jgi:hypothetical protein